MVEKKRLGRGLAALIGEADVVGMATDERVQAMPTPTPTLSRVPQDVGFARLPISDIGPNPQNPRRQFSARDLDGLARSIREKGVIQPIVVRPLQAGPAAYELVAGERRWRAAQAAGVHQIPALIRALDDREAQEIALIENVQRTDLNPMEEADGYQGLMDRFDYTQAELATIIGKSRSHITNMIRLKKLPQSVQEHVMSGALTMGHARALVGVEDAQVIADRIVREGMTVRDVENLLHDRQAHGRADATAAQSAPAPASAPTPAPASPKDPNTQALEDKLCRLLGLKVEISHHVSGKGKIAISYSSLEQLDDVCQRLSGSPREAYAYSQTPLISY